TTLKLAGAASLVRFTRDGSHLFVVERSDHTQLGQASLLEVRTGQPRFPPILNLTDAALSPDEEWLAVARADNAIELIVIRTGSVARRIAGHSDRVERIAFSPNSTVLLSASRDRTVRRWRVASGEAIGPALRHDFPVVRAVFSADGSRIATVATANDFSGPVQFQTWIVASGRPLRPPILGRGFDGLAAFDPSGRYLLTADREPAAQLWNVDTHTLVLPPLVVESRVRCFDFSPDGAYLALGGEDGTVKLWDAETGRRSFATLPQTGAVRSIRFNGEGTRLLVAGEDGTVRLWDLAAPSAARSRLFYSNVRPHVALVDGDSRMVVAARGPKRLLQVDLDSPDLDSVDLESSAAPEWGPFVVDADGRQWAHSSSPERDLDLRRGLPVVPSVVELWSHEPGAILIPQTCACSAFIATAVCC
ncbi:MAG: WD40 repeat domain-containing protein, partial [Nitrospira sp.]|nr:WD40 repeat domain-containing protein [Nitrospira sp.]